jgi:hypothetical protein
MNRKALLIRCRGTKRMLVIAKGSIAEDERRN